jgi:alkanesulfonate monooxygenase SsuD/methylene tetrahydromethanopterin reductase-like flavin-dependent oxidoreductase (luciferase family)
MQETTGTAAIRLLRAQYDCRVRVGVLLLPTDPWGETVERVRRLEALGYSHLWTYDHLSWRRYRDRPWFSAIPWLTGLAGVTSRVRLGTMVTSPNFRHPVTLAKEAMTLDHISGGRVTLGIGAGGVGADATVFGGVVPTPAERTGRLEEFVDLLDQLLRQPATSHRGHRYPVDDARMIPGCVQRPRLPLAIAAGGRRTLELAARYADAWITYGDTSHRERSAEATERIVRSQTAQLAEHCARHGRDPAEIERIYLVGNTDERPLASLAAFTDFVGRYQRLGFTDIVFHHPRADDPVWTDDPAIVETIGTQLIPTLG